MPVAHLRIEDQTWTREFPAPKRADLRGWWNAARKALRGEIDIGLYQVKNETVASVTYESIIFENKYKRNWVLVIKRRR